MSNSYRINKSLTAAALATILVLGGSGAAIGSSYAGEKGNSSTNSETVERKKDSSNKPSRNAAQKSKDVSRNLDKRDSKALQETKASNSEKRIALKELKLEKALIEKEFKLAIKNAKIDLGYSLEDDSLSEEQINNAKNIYKDATRIARESRKTSLESWRVSLKEFAKEFNTKIPNFNL